MLRSFFLQINGIALFDEAAKKVPTLQTVDMSCGVHF